jgi:hypothetical protein
VGPALRPGFLLGIFLYFLFQTAFRGTFSASSDQPVRLPLPVEAFLLADPFVGAMTLLSTHACYRGLAWSLAILALTVLFGACSAAGSVPFGTLHHFFGWIFPSRYLKGSKRVEANKTHTWQRGKYYLMYGFLGAALVGSAIGGLFDSDLRRGARGRPRRRPALQYLGIRSSSAAADTNLRALQSTADATQDFFAQSVWTANQAYFHQTWLIMFFWSASCS